MRHRTSTSPPPQIGPGMFALSALFQQAGWMPSIALMVLIAVWTSQSALYMAQTMAGFAGNGGFSKRMEMGNTMFHLLPRWAYYLSMATLCIVFFSQNLANIVLTSQVMDYTLLSAVGRTCSFDYTKGTVYCVTPGDSDAKDNSPFGASYVVSLGYMVVLALCIPLGMLNLDDNIGMQIGGMLLTVVCVVVWFFDFSSRGLHTENMPALPSNFSAYPTLLSTVIFNYGFVATIPSWLNEKALKVRVSTTVWWSVLVATAQFLLVSVPAAMAVASLPNSCNLLAIINGVCAVPDAVNGGNHTLAFWRISKIMVFIFPIANILTSIPVFSIIIRYNILQIHGVRVPVWLANLFSVVLPWLVALPFFGGDGLNNIINWSSAVFFILLNLVLPLWAYLQYASNQAAGLPPIDPGDEPGSSSAAPAAYAALPAFRPSPKSFAEANEALMREASASLLAHDFKGQDVVLESLYGEDSGAGAGRFSTMGAINRDGPSEEGQQLGGSGSSSDGSESGEGTISAMPWCFGAKFSTAVERGYAIALLGISVILAIATLALQVYLTVDPPPADDDDGCVKLCVSSPLALLLCSRPPPTLYSSLRPLTHLPQVQQQQHASAVLALEHDELGVWGLGKCVPAAPVRFCGDDPPWDSVGGRAQAVF